MRLRKVGTVARRELVATVTARGFVLGVLVMPLLIGGVLALLPKLLRMPAMTGVVAVIDRSAPGGGAGIVGRLAEPRIRRGMADLGPIAKRRAEIDAPPALRVEVLPADADVATETARLVDGAGAPAGERRLAVAVVSEACVRDGAPFELYSASKLDLVLQAALSEQLAEAIVDARLEQSGLDAQHIRTLVKRPSAITRTVTAAGHEDSAELARILMPFAFMMLLWVATFTAGQLLLTTLVEEKSQRVMEVLLSAVSPIELLTGKILGHVGVGFIVLGAYLGLGTGMLATLRVPNLVTLPMALLLAAFFVIAFLLLAALMAAVGSVVDDLRSAQSLLSPILLLMSLPLILWLPLVREPGSTLAVLLSFVPPLGPFVTVLRLGSPEPVPPWQIAASLACGSLSVVAAIWAAAKIFRIGVLLYGKAPTFTMLLRWLRRS